MNCRSLFLFVLALIVFMPTYAEENVGQVFLITNVGTPTVSMSSNTAGTKAVAATTNESDPKQQWYVVGDDASGFYFRNVATGAYLSSPNATSAQWTLEVVSAPVDNTMLMSISEYSDAKLIHVKKDTYGYGYAHRDASNNIVGWAMANVNTHWQFKNLNFSEEQIADLLDKFHNVADEIAKAGEYESHLSFIFEDKACTTLKEGVSLTDNEHFNALPTPLQNMALKIQGKDWTETYRYNNKDYDWESDYAEKYRVQLYEPYSEGSNGAALAGIQAYTNMNNPTGIVGDKNDMLYVMVEDDVLPGASLYISGFSDTGMYNSVTDGQKLHKGLNIIQVFDDNCHYFIYYSVETAKNKAHTQYKVTEFPDIKIHIEGGRLNGFFNYIGDALYAKDTRKDLEYTVMRATHPMYDLVGKYVILHLHLEDTPSQPGEAAQKCLKSALITNPTVGSDRETDPVKIMTAWDNMCFAERILMGIQSDKDIANDYNLGYYETIVGDQHSVSDGTNTYYTDPGFFYSDYFNNRMMGISQQGTLFMNATSWRTAYNVSTIDAILTLFPSGNIWGPAHEYGHMNQGPMNMAGTTEVSNNIFSNVAMYYAGVFSSRCELPSVQNDNFQNHRTYLDAGTWGTTRMFWQLWCYYHATGHNKKFYPRLYQLLRQHPLTKTVKSAGNHNERYDMLHFAKMCCIAAEEDLTNFFTAWGFFEPLKDYEIDDYSVYNAYLTQEDIDAVKEEIKAFNFPKNDVIILIDDRPGSTRTSYPGFPISDAGELGGLKDFDAENGATPSGNYQFTLDVNTVTVETDGSKGVGYLIYDKDGELMGFYNTNSFDVPDEIADLLRSGEATIVVAAEDKEVSVTVVNTILDGTAEKKQQVLSDIIERCNSLLSFIDATGTKVGYLRESNCEELIAKRNAAQKLMDENSEDGDLLTATIMQLTDAYQFLTADETARIEIERGASYRIANQSLATRALATKEDYNTTTHLSPHVASSAPITAELDPFFQQWTFEETETDNAYALRNVATEKYIGIVDSYKANTVIPMSDGSHAYTKGGVADKTGVFYLAPDNRAASSIHMNNSGYIYHYNTASVNTQWTITRVNTSDYMALRNDLKELVATAKSKLQQAGTATVAEPVAMALTASCLDGNAKQPSGNGAFTSWNVLVDNNPTTYFASNRQTGESTDGLDHYIKITAPGDDTFRHFILTYTNNSFASNAAYIRSYRIEASVDGTNWAPVFVSHPDLDVTNSATNSSDLISVPEGTKQIRFVVTKSDEYKAFHYTFLLADIAVSNTHTTTYVPDEAFPNLRPTDMELVDELIIDANYALRNPATSQDALQTTLESLSDAYDNLVERMNIMTSVDEIKANNEAAAEYYLLNGIRVANPARGFYIRRQGAEATKVQVK
ncbi:MAG: M60 family metallopeptidase [Muribaculaceae bacterium]|nr:M60 family metallopeptidase [Muribaculaceae bacterium]